MCATVWQEEGAQLTKLISEVKVVEGQVTMNAKFAEITRGIRRDRTRNSPRFHAEFAEIVRLSGVVVVDGHERATHRDHACDSS